MLGAPRLSMLVLKGSVVVLTQLCLQDTSKDFYWFLGVIISAISTAIVAVLVAAGIAGKVEAVEQRMHLAVSLLVALWVAGTAIMTLKAPFKQTGNGYFGSWCALITSWMLAAHYYPSLREPVDRLANEGGNAGNLVFGLLLASLTVFVQTSWNCIDSDYEYWCNGDAEWVLACSGVAFVLNLGLLLPRIAEMLRPAFPFLAIFMFIWWTAGFGVATFIHPYELTGNGFFGCWAAFALSGMLVDSSWNLGAADAAEKLSRRVPRPLILLTMATAVVALAGYWKYDNSPELWVVIYAGISFALCLGTIVLVLMDGDAESRATFKAGLTGFQLLYWLLGAMIMTFHGPFKATSNGYFAAWACLICSWLLCVQYWALLEGLISAAGDYGYELAVIVFAALVLLMQATVDISNGNVDKDLHWAAAPICSVATLVVACAIARSTQFAQNYYIFAIGLLAIIWAAAVGVLTFGRPYYYTGNAYFAIWTAYLTSFLLLVRQLSQAVAGAPAEGPLAPGGGPPASMIGARA